MQTTKISILAALAALLAQPAHAAETYGIDPVHSTVGFSIRHFVGKVTGKFSKFGGAINVDRANLEHSSVEATIEIPSVNTDNQDRDKHLLSPDFFDAGKHPTMTFRSTAWKKTGEGTFDVAGNLTLKGVTKPAVLKVTLLGFGPGMNGAQLSGWEATTTIDKKQWGMIDPAMLDAALGDDVTITLNIEAVLKKS